MNQEKVFVSDSTFMFLAGWGASNSLILGEGEEEEEREEEKLAF